MQVNHQAEPLSSRDSSSQKKMLLVSNDDGYQSQFLKVLVQSLLQDFDVFVVAPLDEQSWVGRAMSRSGELEAIPLEDWPCPAWAVSGRPADCVNIGLNHLMNRRPDAVISGMNLGFNVSLPLTLSSGTVAAATEGALAGLPALAFSLAIPREEFLTVSQARGKRDEIGETYTRIAADHARQITHEVLSQAHQAYHVHNINFPPQIQVDAQREITTMTIGGMPSLFKCLDENDLQESTLSEQKKDEQTKTKRFSFAFSNDWHYSYNPQHSDIESLKRGAISHCVLRWDRLSLVD